MRLIFTSLMAGSLLAVGSSHAACPPAGMTRDSLLVLKAAKWKSTEPAQTQTLASGLLGCLSDPDPVLRDQIAFEALSAFMRSGQLNQATLHQLRTQLLHQLRPNPADTLGVTQAFAAITLAEIARVDRKQPFLSPEQRLELVSAASNFLIAVRDYRGLDDKIGWRHNVAHGADFMLQLALNPALERPQHETMLAALSSQIAPGSHAYQYGEGERLMAPVYYLGMRAQFSAADWDAWFTKLLAPFKAQAANTQVGLTQRHNLNGFLLALYFSLQEGNDAEVRKKMLPAVVKALKELG